MGRLALVALVLGMMIGTPALANYITKLSFDRQVVGADAFLIVEGSGERPALCPGGFASCVRVRVIQTLKGAPEGEILLRVGHPISELDLDCCRQAGVYAVAVVSLGDRIYGTLDGNGSVYQLPGWWPDARQSPAQPQPDRRRLSFDQLVVAADNFVVVEGTGEVRPCGPDGGESCAVVWRKVSMKGEAPRTFMVPVSQRVVDFSTGQSASRPHGCCEAGQIYALALDGGRDGEFTPIGGTQGVVRLGYGADQGQ